MKKILFYFDRNAVKMFVDKVNEAGEKTIALSSPNNFVARAEIVARVIDVNEDTNIENKLDPGYTYYNVADFKSLKVDWGVYFDPTEKAYKASEFGFITYNNGTLRLLPAMSVTRDKLKAYFFVHPTKFGKIPSYQDIEEYLLANKILAGLGQKKIEEDLMRINPEEKKLTKLLVAKGKEPVTGHDEYFIPIINIDKKAGEILSDGRINYKEVGSIIQVTKHQELLKRVPAVKPENGYNIYGDKVVAETEIANGLKKGANIVQSGNDENIFCSAIDGCVVVENKIFSVLPIAVINGDVNYETGNIDFNGSVHIHGSVIAGFNVKATGDIIVEKTVEDATIQADGDITVKMGVVGKEAVKIIAGGNLNAKYLLNAKVETGGDIIVEDSIINCYVFSNNMISVVAKSGKIIGGEVTALHEIVVKVSGAPNETETVLKVGRNIFIERKLRDLKKEIARVKDEVAETMRLLKVNFGEGVFEDPKKYISILPAIKKKKCLTLLQELNAGNKELKVLMENARKVQQGLKLERDPVIRITDKVYPGTIISIKRSVKKIDSIASNVKYYEDPAEKIVRFTAAN